MFSICSALENLNLPGLNTSKVTNMGNMFSNCPALKKLNISRFTTNSANNMNQMFFGCKSLDIKNLIVNDKKILEEFKFKI